MADANTLTQPACVGLANIPSWQQFTDAVEPYLRPKTDHYWRQARMNVPRALYIKVLTELGKMTRCKESLQPYHPKAFALEGNTEGTQGSTGRVRGKHRGSVERAQKNTGNV